MLLTVVVVGVVVMNVGAFRSSVGAWLEVVGV